MMDELIIAVSRAANLPREQAGIAVKAMLRFLTARLPSALVGELHARLEAGTSEESSKSVPPPHASQQK